MDFEIIMQRTALAHDSGVCQASGCG